MRDVAETASEEAAQLRAEARARAAEARDAEVLAAAAEGRARMLEMVASRRRDPAAAEAGSGGIGAGQDSRLRPEGGTITVAEASREQARIIAMENQIRRWAL